MLSETIKKNLELKYRDSTIKRIESGIKNIFLNVFKTDKYDKKKLYELKKIKEYLETVKIGSRKTLVANILSVLNANNGQKKMIERYTKYFNKIILEYDDETKYKDSSEKEKKNYIEWKNIIEIKNKYKSLIEKLEIKKQKDLILYEKYILLLLYTEIPPLRGEDYFNTVFNYNKDFNYINLNTNVLHLKKYKTSKKYGTRKIDIPVEVSKELIKWLDIQKEYVKLDKYWLLPKVRSGLKENINSKGLTKMMTEIFKPNKISVVMLRKIYISKILDDKISVLERKRIAKIMGHSIDMQEFIYSRFKK